MTSCLGPVLVADDDAEIRELLVEYLSGAGFDVVQAANGLEALLSVKRDQPRAIVLDINMPRLGGLEALKRIRAYAPATRVVIYSASVSPEVEQQALAAGAVAAFQKPGALVDLRAALEGVVPSAVAPVHVAAVPAKPVSAASRPSRGLRILLVDDDPHINELLGEFCALRGVTTFPVTNAVDALRLLSQGTPDAIFLDIDMPGLSGLDALPAIRAIAPDVKIVMLSGINDEGIARQTLARGAFDYIRKPLDLTYLARTLDTITAMNSEGL